DLLAVGERNRLHVIGDRFLLGGASIGGEPGRAVRRHKALAVPVGIGRLQLPGWRYEASPAVAAITARPPASAAVAEIVLGIARAALVALGRDAAAVLRDRVLRVVIIILVTMVTPPGIGAVRRDDQQEQDENQARHSDITPIGADWIRD